MSLGTALPYGLRDVKITPYTDASATVLGTPIDLPNSRTFSFSEAEEFTELRGDDKVVTTRGQGAAVEWELESGGLSFEILQAFAGGTIVTSGATPNEKQTFTKKVTDTRPFFKVEGQIISDSGGDVHCVLDRCRVTGNIEGEFSDGEFFLTSGSGAGLPSLQPGREDTLYEFVQNESATAISSNDPTGVTAGTPGSFTPSGSAIPADLAGLTALGALGQTIAWTTGQFVVLADYSVANWDGSAWAAGPAA